MSSFIEWAGGTLVAVTLLLLLVLAARGPVAHAFGARAAYALWALPALRMLLPPLPDRLLIGPGMTFDVARGAGLLAEPAAAAAPAALPAPPMEIALPAPAAAAPLEWGPILIGLWLAGAALFFAWQILTYRRFVARALAGSTLLTRAAGIDVRICPAVDGPMATGLIHRRILLPADVTTRFTAEERRLALAHETAHHCRGDLIANFAALALLSLHWFNPLAHRAYRLFRDDQEAACDATVLDAEAGDRRAAYGTAILKSAASRSASAACALSHRDALHRRMTIMIARKGRIARATGHALALVLVGSGLAASASTLTPPLPIAPPAPPAPIAAPAPLPFHHDVRVPTEAERAEVRRAARHAAEEARRATREAHRAGREGARAQREAARAMAEANAALAARGYPPVDSPAFSAHVAAQARAAVAAADVEGQVARALEAARIGREEGARARAAALQAGREAREEALAEARIARLDAARMRAEALAEGRAARARALAEARSTLNAEAWAD